MEFEKLRDIIVDVLSVNPDEVKPDTKFIDDTPGLSILEARAVLCDSDHNLIIDLGCIEINVLIHRT